MNIVADTNVLMSVFITPKGVVSALFEEALLKHVFYISEYSLIELAKHSKKLIKASGLTTDEFEKAKTVLLKKINVVPSHFIPDQILIEAYKLVKGIDENDTVFIATAMFVNGILWTGDHILYKGLQKKEFSEIVNTARLRDMLNQ